jgi:hypothetical protein
MLVSLFREFMCGKVVAFFVRGGCRHVCVGGEFVKFYGSGGV